MEGIIDKNKLEGKKFVNLANRDNFMYFLNGKVNEQRGKSEDYEINGEMIKVGWHSYRLWENYLLPESSMECNVPNGKYFDLSIQGKYQRYVFKSDGTVLWYEYEDSRCTNLEEINYGTYEREAELIRLNLFSRSANKSFVNYLLVADENVYDTAYIIEEKARYLEYRFSNSSSYGSMNNNAQINAAPWDNQYYNFPCPHCGKKQVRATKWEDKQFSVAFWGIFSRKLHCRFKCDACKEMWN